MICRIGAVVRQGRAVTVHQRVDPAEIVRAVRNGDWTADEQIVVHCPDPAQIHEYVGYIHPEMGLKPKTALAYAARSRGLETKYDERLQQAREKCREITVEDSKRSAYRQELARADTETERLREKVATARGRVRACKENDMDPAAARDTLKEAIKTLSEVETTRAAARQKLDRARKRARDRRDTRERKRRLEDKIANLERRARGELCEQLRDEYRAVVAQVPESGDNQHTGKLFDNDPVTAALAIAQIAALSAPVVLACDRFESATAAARWLDAAVIEV